MKYLLLCSLLINNCTLSMFSHLSPQTEEYLCKVLAISQPKLDKIRSSETDKKKYLSFYRNYLPLHAKSIATILPMDLCQHIDELFKLLTLPSLKKIRATTTGNMPTLAISNNGHYYTYNIPQVYQEEDRTIVMSTDQEYAIDKLPSSKNKVIYSPNSEYCIIIDDPNNYKANISFYNIAQLQLISLAQEAQDCTVTISNDSKYILIKQQHPTYPPSIYTLWTINPQGKPQEIPLKKRPGCEHDNDLDILYGTESVIFLSDNKHIIYNDRQDQLQFCDIATQTSKVITPYSNIWKYQYRSLINPVITTDNKHLLYERCYLANKHDYALFNIETLNNIEPIIIGPQSCHITELPILSIPHKNMFTHITNKGYTLNLIDKNGQTVASHTTENGSYITALAVDITGNYLASGYSDGTIMIWTLSDNDPAKYTKLMKETYSGSITSLIFSDNQLLLSQAILHSLKTNVYDPCINKYIDKIYKFGSAVLWDVYGKSIINFGKNIIQSIMSKNGKTVIVISIEPSPSPSCNPKLTVSQHTLHEHISLCAYKTNPHL